MAPSAFWINAALVLATLVIAVFAVVQAMAAKRSATVAEHSARFAQQALKDSERADLLLESIGIVNSMSGTLDGHARVVMRFKNFGRTRAKDVRCRARLIIPNVPDYTSELPVIVLGPGQEQSISFSPFIDFLTKETFEQIISGKTRMQFEGWAVYEDVFGDSYTTRVAGTYEPRNRVFRVQDTIAG